MANARDSKLKQAETREPPSRDADSSGVYLDLSLEDLNYGNLRRRANGPDAKERDAPSRPAGERRGFFFWKRWFR